MSRHFFASLLLAVAACVTDDAGPDPAPEVPASLGCTTEVPAGHVVVGCGFGPGITPIAADDGRVYVVSSSGTFSAIDLATATKTRLFRYRFTATAAGLALGVVVRDGTLYFPGNILDGSTVRTALMALDGATPDGTPRVLAWGERYQVFAPMFGDGERLYAESIVHEGFSASSGPVVAIGYDGSGLIPRTTEYGMPVGIASGALYYRHDREVKRMPIAGGVAEVVASGLSDGSYSDRAVDADYVYTTTAAAPYELRRFGAGRANELVLAAPPGDGEFPRSAPHHLRRDGDWLYFMQNLGSGDGYAVLERVRADGIGGPESIAAGNQLTPPVFDEAGIYVAYTRGGTDEPIEGVVVRIAQ